MTYRQRHVINFTVRTTTTTTTTPLPTPHTHHTHTPHTHHTHTPHTTHTTHTTHHTHHTPHTPPHTSPRTPPRTPPHTPPHKPPHTPHTTHTTQTYDSNTHFFVCVTVMFQNPTDTVGATRRRRNRRLRAFLKHVRMTVALPWWMLVCRWGHPWLQCSRTCDWVGTITFSVLSFVRFGGPAIFSHC